MFSANTSQVSNDVKYIEDFFSAWLRTGTGSSQTVTTGIKENTGALVISKSRSAATDWAWYDTFRGATKDLVSNSTAAETTQSQGLTAFNTDGHTWGTLAKVNTSGATYVDFVLKPTPKFFDVVTYTGNGTTQNIAHNLGSAPGFIVIKRLNGADDWRCYHQSLGINAHILLNDASAASPIGLWNGTSPTSTQFSVGTYNSVNASGGTYIAYLFAHNAGGFGLTGTDNVITCGSFTTGSGSGFVNIGFEPQWILTKRSNAVGSWVVVDVMRGMTVDNGSYAGDAILIPNTAAAEANSTYFDPQPTGFNFNTFGSSQTWIYIAIRRGPMRTPTSGTSVFDANASAGTGSTRFLTTGFPVDLSIASSRSAATHVFSDRLRGGGVDTTRRVYSQLTNAEDSTSGGRGKLFDSNTGITLVSNTDNGSGDNYIYYGIRRAPSFFDEVCYTGTGTEPAVQNHNLGVVPELMIIKSRSAVASWLVYSNFTASSYNWGILQNTNAFTNSPYGTGERMYAQPTSTTFTLPNYSVVNASGSTYVAYLFASCPGVSKVGSYTGNGSSQTINCGFTGGARFVLIKRTDSTGDWMVWDTARGIVSANDPVLALNATWAEDTLNDDIDPSSVGFVVNNAGNSMNVNGATYIYLAIA